MTRKDICKLIRARRRELNKSQKQLATELGMPFQRISEIERGNTNLSIDRLINICNALNLKIDIKELATNEKDTIKVNGIEYPLSVITDLSATNLSVSGESVYKSNK